MSIDQRIGIGFGTAGLGTGVFQAVTTALESGFTKFDTAEEHDYWYDQSSVGKALQEFFSEDLTQECIVDKDAVDINCTSFCSTKNLQISTKIPPWELTSVSNIRNQAKQSRETLLGFCDAYEIQDKHEPLKSDEGDEEKHTYPLDVYYIHAPRCWDGWHTRCNGVHNTLPLREAWVGMEMVVHDGNAKRIGLSNISIHELLDVIRFVKDRQQHFRSSYDKGEKAIPPPRMPDVVQIYADPIHPSDRIHQVCKEHGIEFVSYSTLGTQHNMRGQGNPVLGNKDIQAMTEKYNCSTAEIVLSWAMHHKKMSVIPRSSKEEHVRELSNLLHHEPFLEKVDLEVIDALSTED
jgi:diketogulonate reductase-like aldo/keto reductase